MGTFGRRQRTRREVRPSTICWEPFAVFSSYVEIRRGLAEGASINSASRAWEEKTVEKIVLGKVFGHPGMGSTRQTPDYLRPRSNELAPPHRRLSAYLVLDVLFVRSVHVSF